MNLERKDAVVIGAGPGGYVAAIRLGQLGGKVLLVDQDRIGGTCLNYGCIPSKAIIHFANLFDKVKKAEAMGLKATGLSADLAVFQTWKNEMVKKLVNGIASLCKGAHVEIMQGAASFKSPHEIEILRDGTTTRVEFEYAVIATGTKPVAFPGLPVDDPRVMTSKEVLDLNAIPHDFLVIGGGVIGLELGMALQKLGSKLTVVELRETLLAGFDPELVRVVERGLKKRSALVHLNSKITGCRKQNNGFEVRVETPEGEKVLRPGAILVSIGVEPNVAGLGVEPLGLKRNSKGFISVDHQGRTNVSNIFAIGDVNGPPYLAHKAFKEGEVVAEIIAGKERSLDYLAMPWAVFTDPEIASVGLTEAKAQEEGRDIVVGRYPLAASGRGQAMGETEGMMKVIIDQVSKEVLGIHLVCAQASEMISEGALAIEMGAFAEDLASTIHPHPTLSEGIMEAFKQTIGEAVHIANLPEKKSQLAAKNVH